MNSLILVVIMVLSQNVSAQTKPTIKLSDLKPDQQAEQEYSDATVTETEVTVNGEHYRKIVYQTKHFYVKSQHPTTECYRLKRLEEDAKRRFKKVKPDTYLRIVQGNERNKKYPRIFLESLNTRCREVATIDSFLKTALKDLKVGTILPEEKTDTFKEKKVYVQPFQNTVGFDADF